MLKYLTSVGILVLVTSNNAICRNLGDILDNFPGAIQQNEQPNATSPGFYFVTNTAPPDDFLALRTAPSAGYGQRIATMPNGTLLQLIGQRTDGWWFVRVVSTGQEGWALSKQGDKVWIDCCRIAETAAPSANPTAASPQSISEWNSELVAILSKNKQYPAEALNNKEEGTVQVAFTVDRSGNLLDSRIVQTSGSNALHRAAIDLLERTQPFPPLPSNYQKQVSLTLPIRFSLSDKTLTNNDPSQDAPITECDTHAASDQDPHRKAVGVPTAEINPVLAVPACDAAVRQYPNSSRLIHQLGRAYYKANNFDAAVVQFRKAADQGYAPAQTNLGAMYALGQGVSKDDAQAVVWFRKAAEQGSAVAQTDLGEMYRDGRGVPQDVTQAVAWYSKAATQGYAPAQLSLGAMYEKGQGVPKDWGQAFACYRKAADQGNVEAQRNLRTLNSRALGMGGIQINSRDCPNPSNAVAQREPRPSSPQASPPPQHTPTADNTCPPVVPGPGFKVADGTYILTKQTFDPNEYNHNLAIIKSLFGFNAWFAIAAQLTKLPDDVVVRFTEALGIPPQTDERCNNFIVVTGAPSGDAAWIARHDRSGRHTIDMFLIPKSQFRAQAIVFIHTPPSLNAQDQVRLFSKYNDLVDQLKSTRSYDNSNETSFQRTTIQKELGDQIRGMTLGADIVVQEWSCDVTDVTLTYFSNQLVGVVQCQYKGLGFDFLVNQTNPVLRQIRRGASITFDGRTIQPADIYTNDAFPANFVADKITTN